MTTIASIGLCIPPYRITQEKTIEIVRELFHDSFDEIDRLLKVFKNGQIKERYFSVPLDWFKKDHSFSEKNDLYIEKAVQFGKAAIQSCLENPVTLKERVPYEEIDAIFFISSSGISTPTIDAKIMNKLPFNKHCKRIPIWGLGCAGGASGLSRAFEYCKAYPKAKVLVLSVELCSITFQKNDKTKSNLVGTSLFADGIACALVVGDEADLNIEERRFLPKIKATQSTLMPNSEDIMGWKIKNEGFYVIFSKDIPSIIRTWLGPNVKKFLEKHHVLIEQIDHFVAHPGGRKVLEAYVDALHLDEEKINISLKVLENFGNMSSATIFYVLKQFMEKKCNKGDYGLLTALGPGFSSELLLLQWD